MKRKVRGEEKRTPAKTPKKRRTNADIKRYISCKRWREEEEQKTANAREEEEPKPSATTRPGEEDKAKDEVQEEEEGEDHHPQQHPDGPAKGDKAVTTAGINRMPGSILQASQGGTWAGNV